MRAFTAKGRFVNLLREMPVHAVIVNAALLGVAVYGLQQAGRMARPAMGEASNGIL